MNALPSPLAALQDPTLLKTDALIDGAWVGSPVRFAVTDPATGATLAQVADLGAADAKAAIAAANRAWPAWRQKTAKERAAACPTSTRRRSRMSGTSASSAWPAR